MPTRLLSTRQAMASAVLLAAAMLIWAVSDGDTAAAGSPQLTQARQAYNRGRELAAQGSPDAFQQAIEQFRQAVLADTSYTEAYIAIARAYVEIGRSGTQPPNTVYLKARAAALQALNLNDRSPDALAVYATVLTDYLWEWREAERYFQRALELDPALAATHLGYAELLVRLGRFDEAIEHAERGKSLRPASPAAAAVLDVVLYFARRGPRPRSVCDGSLRQLIHLDPAEHAERERRSRNGYVSPYLMAASYAQQGEVQAAFQWLDQAIDAADPLMGLLAVDPAVDPIRKNDRMKFLLDYLDLVR